MTEIMYFRKSPTVLCKQKKSFSCSSSIWLAALGHIVELEKTNKHSNLCNKLVVMLDV